MKSLLIKDTTKEERERIVQVSGKVKFLQIISIFADEGFQHLPVMGDILKICFFIRFPERINDQPLCFQTAAHL